MMAASSPLHETWWLRRPRPTSHPILLSPHRIRCLRRVFLLCHCHHGSVGQTALCRPWCLCRKSRSIPTDDQIVRLMSPTTRGSAHEPHNSIAQLIRITALSSPRAHQTRPDRVSPCMARPVSPTVRKSDVELCAPMLVDRSKSRVVGVDHLAHRSLQPSDHLYPDRGHCGRQELSDVCPAPMPFEVLYGVNRRALRGATEDQWGRVVAFATRSNLPRMDLQPQILRRITESDATPPCVPYRCDSS